MSVKLILEFPTVAELQAYLAARSVAPSVIAHAQAQAAPQPAEEETPAKTKRIKVPKPANQPPATEVAPATPKDEPISYDKIKGAALKLANEKGRDALVNVLKSLGLKSAQDAKPEAYPQLLKVLEDAIKVKEEPLA